MIPPMQTDDIRLRLWRENRVDQEYTISASELLDGFAKSPFADPNYWWGGLTARLVGYITAPLNGLNSAISLGLGDNDPTCTEAEWYVIEERARIIVHGAE